MILHQCLVLVLVLMASSYFCVVKVIITNVPTEPVNVTDNFTVVDYTSTEEREWSIDKNLSHTEQQLYNAQQVSIRRYPFMVRLTFVYDQVMGICAGTLIHPKYILSSKHCLDNGVKLLLVCMAEETIDSLENCYGVARYGYKTVALQSCDLLVIIVTKAYSTSSLVKSIVPQEFKYSDLVNCYSLGWVRDTTTKNNAIHLRITPFKFRFLDERVIGVFSAEVNMCKGDSGGPLICNKKLVGVASISHPDDCKFGMEVSYFVNLNTNLHFILAVLEGQYNAGAWTLPNWTLIISSLTVFGMKSFDLRMRRMFFIGLVLLAYVIQGQDDGTEAPSEGSEGKINATEAHGGAIVRLYLIDINSELISGCSGVFITEEWIVSSGSCLKHATSDCQLKVCPDIETSGEPSNCTGSTFAFKIIFPRHTWYNNIAFVLTDGSIKQNTSVNFTAEGEKPDLSDCEMLGLNEKNEMADLNVQMRRACRVGYYCVDDRTGWACGFKKGSLLICAGQIRGIYSKTHPISCRHHAAGNCDDGGYNQQSCEEDVWALLFFTSFDAYEDLITKVLNGSYFATDRAGLRPAVSYWWPLIITYLVQILKDNK